MFKFLFFFTNQFMFWFLQVIFFLDVQSFVRILLSSL